jgi:hypothetical protein
MPTKYAILITSWGESPETEIALDGSTRCRWIDIDQASQSERDAWREAFGTFRWDRISGRHLCWMRTATATSEATNAENESLMHDAWAAWHAYDLRRPHWRSGDVLWAVSGTAREESGIFLPHSLASWNDFPELFNAYYSERDDYAPARPLSTSWIEDWLHTFDILSRPTDPSYALGDAIEMALFSFMEASKTRTLEFKFPNLVRAIEAIIAIPRHQGKETFASRAAPFAQAAMQEPAVQAHGMAAGDLLRELYQLRSDCVHGKWVLRDMKRAGRDDHVAALEFVAMTAARNAILWAIDNRSRLQAMTTRDLLEDAWQRGVLP